MPILGLLSLSATGPMTSSRSGSRASTRMRLRTTKALPWRSFSPRVGRSISTKGSCIRAIFGPYAVLNRTQGAAEPVTRNRS